MEFEPDDELLSNAARGDRTSLDKLLNSISRDLRRFVAARLDPKVLPRLDASDVIQEVQIDMISRLSEYVRRRPMPFHVWVRKTAYERLLMLHRRHVGTEMRAVEREVSLADRSSTVLARAVLEAASTPSGRAIRQEAADVVNHAIAQLPETDRQILYMKTVEGLPHRDVASVLGIKEEAARKRYGRALLRLHERLEEAGLTDSEQW